MKFAIARLATSVHNVCKAMRSVCKRLDAYSEVLSTHTAMKTVLISAVWIGFALLSSEELSAAKGGGSKCTEITSDIL